MRYFKKLFSVILAAIILATAVAPSDVVVAASPARPSFKLVKRAKKSVTLKINKTKNATGYQIFIANSRNGNYRQTAASRIRTVKITKLKKDKVYYVKIRAFRTVGYHITYGKYSKVMKIDKYGKKKPVPSVDVPTGSAIEETQDPSENPEQTQIPEEIAPELDPEQTQIPEEPAPDYSTEPPKDTLA